MKFSSGIRGKIRPLQILHFRVYAHMNIQKISSQNASSTLTKNTKPYTFDDNETDTHNQFHILSIRRKKEFVADGKKYPTVIDYVTLHLMHRGSEMPSEEKIKYMWMGYSYRWFVDPLFRETLLDIEGPIQVTSRVPFLGGEINALGRLLYNLRRHFMIPDLTVKVINKYALDDKSRDVFLQYIDHLHPTSIYDFLQKILVNKKLLFELLDTELEEMEEEMTRTTIVVNDGGEKMDVDGEVVDDDDVGDADGDDEKFQKCCDLNMASEASLKLEVYEKVMERLKTMTRDQRAEQYLVVGIDLRPLRNSSEKDRKDYVYKKIMTYIYSLRYERRMNLMQDLYGNEENDDIKTKQIRQIKQTKQANLFLRY